MCTEEQARSISEETTSLGKANGSVRQNVPDGFVSKLSGDLVWEGSSYATSEKYVRVLSAVEIEEVELAAKHFKRRGFSVVRGLNSPKYTIEDNIIIYMGILSHITPVFGADPDKMALGHIRDATKDAIIPGDDRKLAVSKYPNFLNFHTDVGLGDILSLYTYQMPSSGGSQRLASFWRIYNELVEHKPDVLATLCHGWPIEGKDPETLLPKDLDRPLVFCEKEKIIIQLSRQVLLGTTNLPRSAGLPPLNASQIEALAALDELCNKYSFVVEQKQGDILCVNNFGILHARDAWTDTPDHKRHILRILSKDPRHAWDKPALVADEWEKNLSYDPATLYIPLADFDPRGKTACAASDAHG
ncbi:hypothetical protein AOL_s00117g37 [Orbilia oligospora ATCC 24927]|uniref:TauD/TfdA-like domain-containing protein n=1 Tax=Arthrobotrys oligospora (strain ATCC 24927 / CBS 115.81 / DSM 1491) TaxID=756982 RepID=G1XLZ0_ARTOA|nr:hypothetical protein AOL_s00117g37 [Orbilia oligospora ATCC 24927]EGX45832.1 hypothetical protein AOL_s00117g37 [Orbilia oligospora ATCC 24927]